MLAEVVRDSSLRTRREEGAKPGPVSPLDPILHLQRMVGNQESFRLLRASGTQQKLNVSQPGGADEQEADRVAEQVMGMRSATAQRRRVGCAGRAPCSDRGDEASTVQRAAEVAEAVNPVPDRMLTSQGSGRALQPALRQFMESRFGHDFGSVRVHADAGAAESADAVSARAFTIGSSIFFGAGRFSPATAAGRRLLAHELTHVVQQGASTAKHQVDSEAGSEPNKSVHAPVNSAARIGTPAPPAAIQRDVDKNLLDEKAKAIIAGARDEESKAEDRAVAAVKSIIKTYYPGESAKVASVEYDDAKASTGVQVSQKFAKGSKPEESTGVIYVGKTFLDGVTDRNFARRVLQVGHELEHITQWRTGLSGGHKANEREFLAFQHEALNPEKPGTGRMSHATRVALIDAALRNFYCLSPEKQKEYESAKGELLSRRSKEAKASGNADLLEPPTTCKSSS